MEPDEQQRFLSILTDIGLLSESNSSGTKRLLSNQNTFEEGLKHALVEYQHKVSEAWLERLDSPWVLAEMKNGMRIWCNMIDNVSKAVMRGEYDPRLTRIINDKFLPNSVFVDIGANIGWFSLYMAQQITSQGIGGRVIAFEPQPDVADRLRRSIQENGFEEIVELHELALSDETREYSMIRDNTNLGGAWISDIDRGHKNEIYGIKSVKFDDVCDEIGDVSVMKIDIEGAEFKFLLGARNFFSNQQPILITEVYNAQLETVSYSNAEEYLELIKEYGYEIFDFGPDSELRPFDFINHKDENSFDIIAIPK